MELEKSTLHGSSPARSESYERNIDQEKHSSFKKSIQLTSSGPEKCPECKTIRTIIKSTDNQQIIKEKILTVIPKGQPFSYEDVSPGVSVTQDSQGNITHKETRIQVVDQQQSAKEEDAGSNDEDRRQLTRRGQGRFLDSRMRTRMIVSYVSEEERGKKNEIRMMRSRSR
ncbi:MAG: hypothetical protein GY861_19350 [bacterium]|nr:hypothetical protein [bacterium]